MKLAFLVANFPCLTETFVFREWEYLQQQKELDVHVFSIRRPDGYRKVILPPEVNLDVIYFRPDHLVGIIFSFMLFPLFAPFAAVRVARKFVSELKHHPPKRYATLYLHMTMGIFLGRYLKRKRFDAIHGHFSAASNVSYFAHLASGIPFSFTLYASDDLFVAPLPYFEDKLALCRFVVTDTIYNHRLINLLTLNRYQKKTHVIYSGVDLSDFDGFSEPEFKESPLAILSIGSMTGVKGYPTVLEALRGVKNQGIQFEYHIVGGGRDSEHTLLLQMINEFGLQDHVKLLGAQNFDVVRNELEWCNLFVMASEIEVGGRRDGFPTVIIEAMLAKRLVLSTYISDIPNNIIAGETGLIVPEKNPEQLAEAICFTAEHGDACKKMVENSHKIAVTKFDAAMNYGCLVKLLCSDVGMLDYYDIEK